MLFKGVGTALITPMTEKGIDLDKLTELIDWQISEGIDAIILCGTTGEAPTISDEEKIAIFTEGVKVADGRVPIIAGTGTNDTAHTIKLNEIAQKAGVDGLLINNPYYNKSSDDGIFAHYEAIGKNCDLPVIIYNVPSRTSRNLSTDLMLRLCELKNIAGFKEASADISQIAELCAKKPERITVYSGNDEQTLPIMAIGGMGVICTCSNIVPKLCCSIADSFFEGNLELAREKQFELIDFHKAMFCEANPIPLKTAMNLVGMNVGKMRLPLTELTGSKLETVKKALIDYGFELK